MTLTDRFLPSRIANLGFSAQLPADWIAHDLPEEAPDFSEPSRCFPLAILTAPYAAIIFAAAARPAYEDGTLNDWAWFLLDHNGLSPRAIGPLDIAGVPALAGEAVQESDIGTMLVRFAFLEDGGRLINLSLSAPEPVADSVRGAWFALLSSFTLESPQGSRFSTPIPAPGAPEAPDTKDAGPPPTASSQAPVHFAQFALTDTPATLDPEHPVNVSMRNSGAGFVPKIVATNDEEKRATLAAGAITSFCNVPYGWHVIDDGQRTVVLDPGGAVQINLSMLQQDNQSQDDLLDDIEAQMRKDYPHPEFVRLKQGRIHALGARNIADGAQPLEQYHLLFPSRADGMVLRARVTAIPSRSVDACNLAELILESCSSEDPLQPGNAMPAESDGPAWYRKAVALEAENRLEEAEQAIRGGCPYIGYAQATAELYFQRMIRLQQGGDTAGALEAFKKSSSFIRHYASLATSGGEGAALSSERDEFRRRLVAAYGHDPED